MSSGQYVLLDRDGVINNDSDDYIKSAAEWHPLPRSLQAIALLNKHGLKVAVITNQIRKKRGEMIANTFKLLFLMKRINGAILHQSDALE